MAVITKKVQKEKELTMVEKVALIRLQGKGFLTQEGNATWDKMFQEEIYQPNIVVGKQGQGMGVVSNG